MHDKDFDADFYAFRPKGKWKYHGEGFWPENLDVNHDTICAANGGLMPGMSSQARYLTIVAIPKNSCNKRYAYPRMIPAEEID